jgi:hypothetical protein
LALTLTSEHSQFGYLVPAIVIGTLWVSLSLVARFIDGRLGIIKDKDGSKCFTVLRMDRDGDGVPAQNRHSGDMGGG